MTFDAMTDGEIADEAARACAIGYFEAELPYLPLTRLCTSFGAAEIDAILHKYRQIERACMIAIYEQWLKLPKADRPNLPILCEADRNRGG